MANTLTNVLPKLLAQGLLALRENAVMPRLVNRSYDRMAAMKGNAINIPLPAAITATAVTPSITMASNVDLTPSVAVVTLDFWREASFHLSDSDFMNADPMFVPMSASEAIKALANAVDAYIIGKHTGIYSITGTAGTTPFATSVTDAAAARKLLNKTLAPLSDRRCVIDPDAEEKLLQVSNILEFQKSGEKGPIIDGTIGRKLGFDFFMNQNLTTYTPGTGWVTGFIASTVGVAVGDTTINVINATASGTILVGDIFDSGAGQYVVTAAATVSATVAVALSFTPAMATAVATSAAITVGAGSTAYQVNLAFHRDAFAWASRPIGNTQSVGNTFRSVADPISGIALRIELSRQYKQDTYSYDILGGAGLVRAALAAKIKG